MAQLASSLRLLIRANVFPCLAFCYLLFVLLGAAVFTAVEAPPERELRAEVERLRRSFLREHACVGESELSELLGRALSARRSRGAAPNAGGGGGGDFVSSLYFVILTLTTMGSDSDAPKSDEAKLFFIFYCALGIPSTLFLLSVLSHLLLPVVTHSPVQHLRACWGLPHSRAALVHAGFLSLLVFLLLFFLPALVVCAVEPDWSFLDAFCFCFGILSTIGEGGKSLGDGWGPPAKDALKLLTTWYLLVGLVVIITLRDTVLQVPRVHAAMRLFSGVRCAELEGFRLSELTPADDNCEEEPQYSQSVCTVSSTPLQLMSPRSNSPTSRASTLESG